MDITLINPFVPQRCAVTATTTPNHLDHPHRFALDMSGIACMLGGDDAVHAMAAAHVCEKSPLLGLYNGPGALQIARQLNSFWKSAYSHTNSNSIMSNGVHVDPTTLFQWSTFDGPKFRAAHSGTVIDRTSCLAALFVKECAAGNLEEQVVEGRKTRPVRITIADLGRAPNPEWRTTRNSACTVLYASFPVATSIGAGVLCAIRGDLYASSLILVGIIASGISCFVLGSARLAFTHPEPAKGSPAGDGILGSDQDIILLKGTEGLVNSITRGALSLRFSSKAHFDLVWWCSALFSIQGITQLLLIPYASLFGQVMFLASVTVTGLYHASISSSREEKAARKVLFQMVQSPTLHRYTLGTRTSAVVFILLVLRAQDSMNLLNELLPNDTKVWKRWKELVLNKLQHPERFLSENKVRHTEDFTGQEQALLETLYEDARAAYSGYKHYLGADLL